MFTVHPNEIKDFTGDQLVALLRALLYAEASKAGVPLRGVDVPLQITVADGGRDGTVSWVGGADTTDYFPSRDVVFQCKAKDTGNAMWEREVWTKPSQSAKVRAKVLNEAVKHILACGGSYVGITAKALVGTKPADRVAAIRRGIAKACGDPNKLAAIHVYEGNTLAAWASTHPAVAVWIKQLNATIELAGFSTLTQWGKRADIAAPTFVDSPERKFFIGAGAADAITFSQLAARLADILEEPGTSARLWGASGIGKTRALHHALSASTGLLGGLTEASFIFCDYREVTTRLTDVANQIVKNQAAAILVVDACPLDKARELNAIARGKGSKLRVLTIGAEGADNDPHCVMIRPAQADRATITAILKSGLPKARADELDYITELCDGFPRIAVLAAKSYEKTGILKSVDDVAQQILSAAGAERDTVRALECLSLFEKLAPDENPDHFDDIAETLVHMKGELMYEHLVIAADQHLVERNRGVLNTQPRPIADFLAQRRLSYLRPSTLIAYLERALPQHRTAMLGRWRYLARSQTLREIVNLMLRGSFLDANILGPEAEPYLAAFARVAPDRIGTALYWTIGRMPLDELEKVPVTDGLVETLRLLAGRRDSFAPSAQMVLRLAAVAETEGPPPITRLLRQLFQVALAGTQADDKSRRHALEEALEEDDPRIRRAGVEALGAMIQTDLTRSEDYEQIGDEPFRPEWRPDGHDTIHAYFHWAFERLHSIWLKDAALRPTIEKQVARDLRNHIIPELLPTIEALVDDVVATSGHWFSATKRIGDWLYFDSPAIPTNFSRAVRALYDKTIPADPVHQALLYSRYGLSDIHDPKTRYAPEDANPDYEYAKRQATALAAGIAGNPVQLHRVLDAMASQELHSPGPFATALAAQLPDPVGAFGRAVESLEASGSRDGVKFVTALLSALDRRLEGKADQLAALVAIAKRSAILTANPLYIVTSLRVTDERLDEFTADVAAGKVTTTQAAAISYGRSLANVSSAALGRLIKALVARGEDGGAWAALDILSMITHGAKELTADLVALTRFAILSPSIVKGTEGNASHTDYSYDRMLRLLDKAGAIDEGFGHDFALQIEAACRMPGARSGRATDALREALGLVVPRAPRAVWPVLAGFYEIATRIEREHLYGITGATKLFAYDVSRTGAGALFGTPLALMLDWVAGDPDERIGFVVTFFPILERKEDLWVWHPALQTLGRRYGRSKVFRNALGQRIYPTSWGGSLNPHLTSFLEPLASWSNDRLIGDWASRMHDKVKRSLESGHYGR